MNDHLSFLINPLMDQTDLKWIEHLELLNINLNFYLHHLHQKTDQLFNVKLANFMKQLFSEIIVNENEINRNEINRHEINRHEIEFILILSRYFCFFSQFEQIIQLILEENRIAQEFKIEIIQILIEERLIAKSNYLFIIDFVFQSLNSLFDGFRQESKNIQQATKSVNNILWILFRCNDSYHERIAEGIECFFNVNISSQSINQDDQIVELILDFLASLIRFSDQSTAQPFTQHTEVKEIVLNSVLNPQNSSIRKKARYLCDQIKLIPLIAIDVLETLEEKQIHLIQPVIDKKLNSSSIKIKLDIKSFETVLEIIIQRMLDHECRSVKLYALKFIQEQYVLDQILGPITENFILNQVISCLQNNLIYDINFMNEPFTCLERISDEKIIRSLLNKQADGLSMFGLYLILKRKFLYHYKTDLPSCFTLSDAHSIQRVLGLTKMIGDRSIKHTITIYLIKILIRNLQATELLSLFHILYCLNISEIRIDQVIAAQDIESFIEAHHFIQLDKVDLTNNCLLIGFARYLGILYCHQASQQHLYQILNELQETNHFKSLLLHFLQIITEIDQTLWKFLQTKKDCKNFNIFEDREILELVCSKRIDSSVSPEITQILREKIEQSINIKDKLCYFAVANGYLNKELDQLFQSNLIEIDITDENHWKLLNNYLIVQNMNIDQAIKIVNGQLIESDECKVDFLLNLISRTPAEINVHVVEFIGNLLRLELDSETSLYQTLILQNLFVFTDLLFKSCLEIRKVYFYITMFRMFIERIAFSSGLFHSTIGRRFFSDIDNFDQMKSLYEQIFELNTLEIKSILIDHLVELIADDPSLIKHDLFSELMINNLVNACLLDKKFQILTDHVKEQISNDPFISGCLNLNQMNLDFYKETRIKSIFISLKFDPETLTQLINKMMEYECVINRMKLKNFPNSTNHRMQVKIWQYMLMVTLKLLKLINSNGKSSQIETMLRLIYDSTMQSIVKQSSTQQSVRLLQQIILIVLIKDDNCPKEFYDKFEQLLSFQSTSDYLSDLSRNKESDINKIGYITSLLSIMFHLIKSKPELKYYPIFYLINCNHYKTRLFSYLVLVENNVEIDLFINHIQHKCIDVMPKSISGSNNIIKNFEMLRKDWFFNAFNCEQDISLNFVFNLFVKLTNLFNDDLIKMKLLTKCGYDP